VLWARELYSPEFRIPPPFRSSQIASEVSRTIPNNSVTCVFLVRMVPALYRVPAREHSDKRNPGSLFPGGGNHLDQRGTALPDLVSRQ
jgi:hypothetical protein